jgi:hypothetical protein
MIQQQQEHERRRFERQPIVVKVSFAGGAIEGAAATRDIGLGGLYLATTQEIPVYCNLKMRLHFGEQDLEVNGIVVYTDAGEGVGIRFQNLTREAEAIIKNQLPAIETAGVKIERK